MFDAAFWVAIAFVAFCAILAKFAYRRIIDALDARAQAISHQLDEAVRLRKEALALLASYQRKQRDAMQEAEDIIEHARQEAERLAAEAEIAMEVEVKRRGELAQAKIAQAEAQALKDVRDSAVEISLRAAETLIKQNLDQPTADTIIDDAIRELGKSAH